MRAVRCGGLTLLFWLVVVPWPARPAELALPHWRFRVHAAGTSVHALAQTPDGYLWMGTPRGLLRGDGARWVQLDGGRTPGLPADGVTSLLVDRQGSLWLGTEHSGLLQRTPQGVFQAIAGAPAQGTVTALLQSRGGDIWVGTRAGVFRRHQGRWQRFSVTQGLPSDHVTALASDPEGTVWVQTALGRAQGNGDVFRAADVGQGVPAKPPLPLRLQALGGARLNSSAWDVYRGQSTAAALVDRRGDIWMARPGAAGLLHVTPNKRTTYTVRDGLGSNVITSLMEDAEGGVWAGGHAGGATEIRRQRVSTLASAHGLLGDATFAVVPSSQGVLWVAGSGGLVRIDRGQVSSWPVGKGLPMAPRFLAAHSGAVWIAGHDNQVVRFDGETFSRFAVPNNAVAPSGLFVDDDDVLWIAFVDGSVYRWRGNRFALVRASSLGCQNPHAEDPCPTAIHTMAKRAEGGLWMASHGAGVWAFVNDAWERSSLPRETTSEATFTVFEDRTGVLWVSTPRGLWRVQGRQHHRFEVGTGLPSNHVFGLLQDGGGRLWLASSAGIAYIRPNEIDAFVRGQRPRIHAVTFGLEDGLRSEPVLSRGGPIAARGDDGRLWFASPSGLLAFEPPESWPAPVPLQVHIERVTIHGESQSHTALARMLRTPAPPFDLRVEFTAPAFRDPQRLRFRYRLRPSQTAWMDSLGRQAHYAALPVGNHIFEVQGFYSDEPTRAVHAQLAIGVPPKFHQSLWFYMLCLGALVAVAWAWQRRHVRGSLGLAQAPTALAQAEHRRLETISQALSALGWQLRPLQGRGGEDQELRAHQAELARQALGQSQVLVRHALAPAGDAEAFAQALQTTLDIYPHTQSQLRRHGDAVSLGPQVHDELLAWAQAATSRAVNHAGAQVMALELWYTEARVELWLRHDGQPRTDALQELQVRSARAQATFCFHTDAEAGSEMGVVLLAESRG